MRDLGSDGLGQLRSKGLADALVMGASCRKSWELLFTLYINHFLFPFFSEHFVRHNLHFVLIFYEMINTVYIL